MAALRALVFPFRWTRVTNALGTRLVLLRNEWLECKGTEHQWNGPEAKAGTRLRDRCLDSCYENRRQWRREKGKAGRRRSEGMKREGGNE